ncbi:killer cell lectin-like receptor subfamily G member 1 [Sorex fumeus]|uniref:killer cell lectin-like receptor subfamily G member 1 n=1 Tax=Sorex fumeus TaxID=62283 RepID=UPI0024ADEF31|nr:killer cell lectin-like receptor subfamily G member 1 [Sorex fumeus]
MEVTDHAIYSFLGLSQAPQVQNDCGSQPKVSSRLRLCAYGIITLGLLSIILTSLLIVRWILCQGPKESTCDHCPSCPDFWLRHSDHCYYFSVEQKDWNSSLEFCLAEHSQLLMFANSEEMRLFSGFFREQFHWVGLRNRSGWRWEDGTALNFSRILHNSSVQKCGAVNKNGLQASSCEATLKWVCKKGRH